MHVLATQLATLDETDAAVDLGQSPADVVVLSFSDSDLSALAAAWQRREQDAVFTRDVADALEAVAPVVEPAQAADDDGAGMGHDALDIEVDRHRMPELFQAGEPKRRQ